MILSDTAIKRPVFTTMLILALVAFGLVSYPRLGVEMMPNVEFPFATVMTIYPGADPETVETEVSEKIEEAVSTISGVRTLRSISVENVSQVMIEFELEVDADQAIQDVRDTISRVLPSLPAEVETPKVAKLDLGSAPVLQLAVGGPGTIDEVTRFARQKVKEPIQTIGGVGSVDIIGGQEREIKVWVDPGKLDAMGLSVNEVVQGLAANNLMYPGGRLTAGDSEFAVKVDGELRSLAEIENLKLLEDKGRAVRVKDVARVEDGLEERRSAALLDGKPAVTLLVRKQSGSNSVAVGDLVKARLEELRQGFPEDWSVLVATDMTTFTKSSIEHVQFDMLFGGILAVLIVFFFLRNLRSTIICALAIPTSVIGTLTFVNAMGFTLNTMTLLALSLSVGILIDDAIVVLENIYRHMEEGKPIKEAAIYGTREIGLAVLATTLSIVAVFVPVAFMKGIIGKFFFEFGITVSVAVMISLFVAFTLTPMMCALFLKKDKSNWFYRLVERFLGWLDRQYRKVIGWALRHRAVTMLLATLMFTGSLAAAALLMDTDFQPSFDMSEFNVTVKLPTGSTLAHTEEVATSIAEQIRERRELVISTVTSVGSDAQQKQNLAKIYVKLVDKSVREVSQLEVMAQTRELFAEFEDAVVAVEEVNMMGGGDSGFRTAQIQFNVRGGDLDDLDRFTRQIVSELGKIPGFVDLDTTFEGGKPEVQVRIDKERASNMGVTTAQIGQLINSLVGGVEATKYKEGGEDYVVRVRLEERGRQRAAQIAGLKVRAPATRKLVDLANVTRIEPGTGPTQIDRQARQRQITVIGNLEEFLPLGEAVEIVKQTAAKVVPADLVTDFEGEAKMMKESFGHLLFSLFMAILIVYMVLASQFENFIHPLTIMMSLPLAIVGAFAALLIAGQSLSIMSFIGIIMLMGVVTKNAILLIDYTNTLRRRDGLDRTAALLKAGPTRLRPILMTAFATVFGMLPVALSQGHGSEMRSPMATCVIGGLLASTVLTLVVVPVVYSLFDDVGSKVARLFKRA